MNNIRGIIREAVARAGTLPFRRFMDLALYCPNFGYYERPQPAPGKSGDFFTSVSVGPVFGELLAFRFAGWLAELPSPDRRIIEAGAHDGDLAADLLDWLRRERPEVLASIQYWILEPSAVRRERQQAKLAPFADRVRWFAGWDDLPPDGVDGIIFANELLDAMPVHRLGWDAPAQKWFEWGVTPLPISGTADAPVAPDSFEREHGAIPSPLNGERDRVRGVTNPSPKPNTEAETNEDFAWTRMPLPGELESSVARLAPPELLAVMPDGFTTEFCPAAIEWWRRATRALRRGRLLTFDYGLEQDEFFSPARGQGTLRAYHQHRQNDELLVRAGEQDLTAQVNFTAIREAGEAAGLRTEARNAQGRFLTAILEAAGPDGGPFANWDATRRRQFQTLTHPQHLGHSFQVLVQSKRI